MILKNFKDFNIKPQLTAFTGDKIKIDRLLNTEITVKAYKIEDSKAKVGTKLLTLHIEKAGTDHVVFTGSKNLIHMIQRVPDDGLPFKTTIIKDSERYDFT